MEIKMTKTDAKEKYMQFKNLFEELKKRDSEKYKKNIKLIKSQATVYAGIYNNDKILFEKGVKDFENIGLEILESMVNTIENKDFTLQINAGDIRAKIEDKLLFKDTIYHNIQGTHKNNEAYLKFNAYLVKKRDYYNTLKTNFS
jgi:hypothetical protein